MEDKEIVEGNRLIALFEGYREISGWGGYEFGYTRHPTIDVACYGDIQLEYHRKWGWLMPVVEKIESMQNSRFGVDITPYGVEVFDYSEESARQVAACQKDHGDKKIEILWLTVVDFIKWHNTHNQ